MRVRRETVLMTIQARTGTPGLAEAARALGLPSKALDAEFGVVSIDPEKCLFTVRVFSEFLPDREDQDRSGVSGPYSDPRIGPFGTPRR